MSGLELIGIGMSVAGGVFQATTAMAQAEQKAKIARYNQQIAERNKDIAEAQGEADAEDKRRENARQLGTIRAVYGSSGLEMSGSPLDVLTDTATEQGLEVQKIRYKGALRGMGYSDKAAQYGMEADYAPTEGMQGVVSSIFKTGSSILGSPTLRSRF